MKDKILDKLINSLTEETILNKYPYEPLVELKKKKILQAQNYSNQLKD